MPTEKNKRREGPSPANILLNALKRAVEAGVDPFKISVMLDLAISASEATEDGSPKQQANTWREAASTLDKWTATATATSTSQTPTV
jgi:hypothetical protein